MTERTDRQPITQNTLYYGDNLKILREYIPDGSIDLIYLDPRSIRVAIIMSSLRTKAVRTAKHKSSPLRIPGTGTRARNKHTTS